MKKIYTVFLSLLTFFAVAQVKESSSGFYFKQKNDKINVYKEYPSDNSVSHFKQNADGTIEVVTRKNSSIPSAQSFTSTSDIVETTDATGNKYWWIADGTIVKSEIASRTTPVSDTSRKVGTVTPSLEPEVVEEIQIETEKVEPVEPEVPVGKKIIIEEAEVAPNIEVPSVFDESQVFDEVERIEEEDVSSLFEKNYEDMNRKEKKLYKKNEKKIMKQLEKELRKETAVEE